MTDFQISHILKLDVASKWHSLWLQFVSLMHSESLGNTSQQCGLRVVNAVSQVLSEADTEANQYTGFEYHYRLHTFSIMA